MAERQKLEKKKQQRRDNTSKKRQDQFIADYIYHKYSAIYSEAAQFYNILNQKYPTKYDLRRNEDYRKWKRQVMGQPEKKSPKKYLIPSHPYIHSPIQIHPESVLTVVYDQHQSEASPYENPEQNEASPYENPEQNEASPYENAEQSEASPYENPEQNEASPYENPEQNEASPYENPEQNEASPYENLEQNEASPYENAEQSEDLAANAKAIYVDNMQLQIPLLKLPAKPSVTTKTLQMVTEEILQEGDQIEPSIHEEIDQELIEKIICELRAEPELQNVFTNIEQQLELEQIGMDLDIPEDTRLENELENLMIW